MKSLPFRITTAVATFFIGITVAAAWVFKDSEARIDPVDVSESSSAPSTSTLEMVFVLDTTGSMGGLLEGAKQRIWGIVNEVMQSESRPAVKIGLVAYRDRGDDYVTQVLPLTNDLDQVYSVLMGYQAQGGGDTPEDVRKALIDGVRSAGWSPRSESVAQILFLVGDAPPHNDYIDSPDVRSTASEASQKGMIVNTIQCGRLPGTREVWEEVARVGNGQYFSISQDGGVQTIATPYDEQLGQLATKLGGTFVAYGGGAGAAGDALRGARKRNVDAAEATFASEAPAAAVADRAMNKVVNAQAYIGDLLQNLENGSLKLENIKVEELPAELRNMSPEQRKVEIEKRLAERRELRSQIMTLSKQRTEFIDAQRKKLGVKDGGFDAAVSTALREQLKRKGIK